MSLFSLCQMAHPWFLLLIALPATAFQTITSSSSRPLAPHRLSLFPLEEPGIPEPALEEPKDTIQPSKPQSTPPFRADDLRWSILSNIFFLGGGIGYLIWSVGDAIEILGHRDLDDNALMKSIVFIAPSVYLLNSLVDVFRAVGTSLCVCHA